MAYRVELVPEAVEALASFPKKVQRQIARRIDALADDPRPPGSKRLEGGQDIWRLRSGDYRVLYQIREKALLVLVIRIGHRREIYRRLPKRKPGKG